MKKTRLLFVLYDRPNYPGGPIINYLRLLPLLVERGYDVHVLVLYHADYPNARILRSKGVSIYPTTFIVDSMKAVRWILRKAEKIQPDIFIPDVSTPGCFAGKWMKESGIPVVNSHRSDDDNNWGKAIYFSDPQYGFATSAIFCVSNYLLEKLTRKISNPDLVTMVIPSGVSIPNNYSLQKNGLSIVYAGRLVQRQKRIRDVVHAFIVLAEKFKDMSFTFIGDGPDRGMCEEVVASSSFQDRMKFVGVLKDEAYKNELAKHDIVVLLSDYEGVPGSLMDSMASGLVPVCYSYPGVDDLVLDQVTGLIVKDRNASVIKAVSTLVENHELRRQISKNARRQIIERFSIEISTKKWESLFDILIEQRKNINHRFVFPSKINLPPANKLLPQHVIEGRMAIFRKIYSAFRSAGRAFFRMNNNYNNEFDNFVVVPLTWGNLDRYLVRTSILAALNGFLPAMHGRLLDAGCGKMPYKRHIMENSAVSEYVGLDIETALVYDETVQPDYTWDGVVMPFEDDSFDTCIAIEVLEHCPEPEVFLGEVHRVLKPGSAVFFTTPFLWNLHETPNDQYRYTPFALERHLRNAGFAEVEIKATGGWHAALAQMLGLWARRAPMSSISRRFISILLKPMVAWLIKRDEKHEIVFSESQMITGLYGLARK